jgi:hypothetical protein
MLFLIDNLGFVDKHDGNVLLDRVASPEPGIVKSVLGRKIQ